MADQVGSVSYMRDQYAPYQAQYRATVKESDRALLRLLEDLIPADAPSASVVDVGCHTGNLLYHIRKQLPRAQLTGWDIFPAILDDCRNDPALKGITFETMNVLDIKHEAVADVLILSAVLFRFSDQDHGIAWQQIHKALKPGGHALVFDFYHEFRQTVRIVDETDLHPNGLVLNLRSQIMVGEQLHSLGFDAPRFHPFNISLDLERKEPSDPINTFTRTTQDGRRLQFRGAIYQPWCHMVARKA